MRNRSILIASAVLLAASPAVAHNQWLLPSRTVLSDTSQMVTVDAGASTEPFSADHNALNVDNVQVWAPDGTMGKLQNVAKLRYRSSFDVAIDKEGTWRIGSQTSSVNGTFKLNGETWAVGRRRGPPPSAGTPGQGPGPGGTMGAPPAGGASGGPGDGRPAIDPSRIVPTVAEIPAGAGDFDLTQSDARNEFFVTAGAPSEAVTKPTGKGLEMEPLTFPTDLVQDEPGKFRFLVDGKPAANLKVDIIPGGQRFRDGAQAQELTTDADGTVTVTWPVAGFYWLNAVMTDDKPTAAKATKRRLSYTATLEVPAP